MSRLPAFRAAYQETVTITLGHLSLQTDNWTDANGVLFNIYFSGSNFGFSQIGSDIFLNYNFGAVIPEPSRALLTLMGLVFWMMRRRRRSGSDRFDRDRFHFGGAGSDRFMKLYGGLLLAGIGGVP